MTRQGWVGDPQWARALAAVALALVAVHGVTRAGGPLVLAREAEPVARLAAEVYCAATSLLHGGDTVGSRGLRSGTRG